MDGIVAIASFLLPFNSEAAAFLRIMRTLRLLRTYQVLARLRSDFAYFRRNEDVIIAVVNLGVFVFVMTAVVYETQHGANPLISNYADALYFTVTALTTTGFGDIVLTGNAGRLISVIVMIFGVTLFLQLARTLFRPSKVRFACPACGLQRHDPDAVHCKACAHPRQYSRRGCGLNVPLSLDALSRGVTGRLVPGQPKFYPSSRPEGSAKARHFRRAGTCSKLCAPRRVG